MSVLVKGMEMPKSCEECRFHGRGFCFLFDLKVKGRCPLVSAAGVGPRPTFSRDLLDDLVPGAVILEGPEFDAGIVGTTTDGRIVYDYDLLVEALAEVDDMTLEEAAEFIDYNTIRALPYMGELAPVILNRLEE